MNPRLVTIAGPLKGMIFPLSEAELSVGREQSNHVCLIDPAVSRRHCLLRRDGTAVSLSDLGSLNCTFVNGVPIKERTLAHGDSLKIGDSLFLFLTEEEETASSSKTVQLDDGRLVARPTVLLRQKDARTIDAPDTSSASRLSRDFNTLLQISTAINSVGDQEQLQRRLLELILEVVPAQRGAIILAGKGDDIASISGLERHPSAERSFQVSQTVVRRVLQEGVAVLSNEVMEQGPFADSPSLFASEIQSLLAVPLMILDKVIGVIYLDTQDQKARFDNEHLQLMNAIAGIAAVTLEKGPRIEWLENENHRLQAEINIEHNMIGESPRMRAIYQAIAKVAPADSTVLIRGESGTGKELAARAIHLNSSRANKAFLAINCATLTEMLLESELFGHEKGAFTGAIAQKKGKLELADGGTVFLDEMGEMAPSLQAKLLRVLQEHEFERVGGTRPIKINVRLIAATNRDLEAAIKDGGFRADLYYRLNVVSLNMPPLRERREDIPLLASYFVAKYNQKCKRQVKGISAEAHGRLTRYDWPGNVRELENAIERAVVFTPTQWIQVDDLPESLLEADTSTGSFSTRYHETLRETKKQLVLKALEQAGGNHTDAAKLLGMHPNNLHRLIQNLELKKSGKNKI